MAMPFNLKLIAGPQIYPVTIEQVKKHLRIDFTDDDADLELKLAAAVDWVESFTGRALVDQTWDVYYDQFPDDDAELRIPKPPLIAVEGVFYNDPEGVEQQVDSIDYYVDTVSEFGWVVPVSTASWPTTLEAVNAVRVRFRAGYSDLSDSPASGEVPAMIRNVILAYVGTFFAHRETIVAGPAVQELQLFEQLLRQHRVQLGMA